MIGKILRNMRRYAKLSQKDIARETGYARNTISQYETGEHEPDFKTIEQIANICGFKLAFINEKTKVVYTSKNIEREEI